MTETLILFEKILNHGGRRTTVIFDLDSTLFDVSGRTLAILKELALLTEFKNKHMQKAELLAAVEVLSTDWGLKEPLRRLGFDHTEEHLPFLYEIRDYWREKFFSSPYLMNDKPYEGAAEYVRAIEAAGMEILYLTGRDRPNMEEGTIRALQHWGFPINNPKNQLYMKPAKAYGEDEDFKSNVLKELKRNRERIWLLDNEPVILHKVAADHPDVDLVFVDTVHSGKALPPTDLFKIRGHYLLPDKSSK